MCVASAAAAAAAAAAAPAVHLHQNKREGDEPPAGRQKRFKWSLTTHTLNAHALYC